MAAQGFLTSELVRDSHHFMADIYDNDDEQRESWLTWLIVFLKRGLRPVDYVTIHGPHSPQASYMWGEAECESIYGRGLDVVFQTSKCHSIWDVRGVRIKEKEKNTLLPIVEISKLPKKWQEEIKISKVELAMLKRSKR
ncbi:MAG: hypothetical protein COV45_05175 [Deltaproteobacteria bacterium CG11_big_fil_rev_8_21_14_0_20_47_16]|nr:MAG: hypothetical protein COV45_05175 [Deltaproteobacteria bacterium CG11_big_fil_rev_8_21_14_0_20_47_16]